MGGRRRKVSERQRKTKDVRGKKVGGAEGDEKKKKTLKRARGKERWNDA